MLVWRRDGVFARLLGASISSSLPITCCFSLPSPSHPPFLGSESRKHVETHRKLDTLRYNVIGVVSAARTGWAELGGGRRPEEWSERKADVILCSPGGGFGPVSDEGYGVSYMLPTEYNIFFHVSSKRSCPTTDSSKFADLIFKSMNDIRLLFDSSQLDS
ncbi:Carnitine O-palmitoyltransferase 1, liver isoform [Portunus trituberculatus]|uniref:Carnitine O-palmitoyltransferase 1, liver isoform n=1 Tax=Portunus trituberculatus TaxID=210409 RepID=A0A5B7CJS7_PORTR|nr:Carnitine O-palmitoyltransferase 1, liver isoform [Portunus trituberculatus]